MAGVLIFGQNVYLLGKRGFVGKANIKLFRWPLKNKGLSFQPPSAQGGGGHPPQGQI